MRARHVHKGTTMAHALELQETVLERGDISLLYRPRVEAFEPEGIEDIQRLLLLLEPERGGGPLRLIAISQKRMPDPRRRERFWGFVDLVLHDTLDMTAALGAQVYTTKTRGVRHLPAARPAGHGSYELLHHDGHTHLLYELSEVTDGELAIETRGDFIVTVMNPDPFVWGLPEPPPLQQELFDTFEVHVTVPAPFPPALQQRFRGRKYLQLDTTEMLDHPGAELVFIAAPDSAR